MPIIRLKIVIKSIAILLNRYESIIERIIWRDMKAWAIKDNLKWIIDDIWFNKKV